MTGARILDGDTVVVPAAQAADHGDIVAALIDDTEATVKRLHHSGRAGAWLMPAGQRRLAADQRGGRADPRQGRRSAAQGVGERRTRRWLWCRTARRRSAFRASRASASAGELPDLTCAGDRGSHQRQRSAAVGSPRGPTSQCAGRGAATPLTWPGRGRSGGKQPGRACPASRSPVWTFKTRITGDRRGRDPEPAGKGRPARLPEYHRWGPHASLIDIRPSNSSARTTPKDGPGEETPFAGSCGVLMGSHDRGVHRDDPVQLLIGVRLGQERGEHPLPRAIGGPHPQPVVDAPPVGVLLWQLHPLCTCLDFPGDGVDHLSVVPPPATPFWCPVRKQRLDPRPLRVSQRHNWTNEQAMRRE
nr:S24 family peptidase [Streptacidiphilus fuscans]